MFVVWARTVKLGKLLTVPAEVPAQYESVVEEQKLYNKAPPEDVNETVVMLHCWFAVAPEGVGSETDHAPEELMVPQPVATGWLGLLAKTFTKYALVGEFVNVPFITAELPATISVTGMFIKLNPGNGSEKTYWPINKNETITAMSPNKPHFIILFFFINL